MIRNFSDHAANERTFLAWVRTAIAVMAFGFLVAKFNLFLKITAESLARDGHSVPVPGGVYGGFAGIVLIVFGIIMIAMAAMRFLHTNQAIESPEQRTDRSRIDVMLAALMVVLGIALVAYLGQTLATEF
jgi:putative membrane protein